MEKDYRHYQVKDLLEDEKFLHWMQNKDELSTHFWNTWLLAYPQKADILKEACQLYEFFHLQEETAGTQQDEQEVLKAIQQTIAVQSEAKPAKIRSLYGMIVRWAATIILMAGVSFALYNLFHKQQEKALVTYQSGDKVRHLTLPDGTHITLNQHSSCRYSPDRQDTDKREVWIEGEAFLEVSHQETKEGTRKPFLVHLQSIDIEVLGTRFNVVNAHRQQNVMLQKGSVRVNQKGLAVMLKPGEIAHVTGNQLIKRQVDPELYTGWLKGKLQLNNTSLKEIIQLLEHKYGYETSYPKGHPFLEQKISGSLDIKNEQALLQTLSIAFNIQISQQDKQILIIPDKSVTNP